MATHQYTKNFFAMLSALYFLDETVVYLTKPDYST